jgi:branched-chain amino acid transport system substrate-binding protein
MSGRPPLDAAYGARGTARHTCEAARRLALALCVVFGAPTMVHAAGATIPAAPPAAIAPGAPAEARLGWFGPSDSADPDGGPFWNGATLAAEEIDAGGGIDGRPLRLVPGWSESPWAGGVSRVARMVYDDGVLALIASIDGAATHLAEQVAAKALVAVVSPGSTDPTVNLAGVPWMYTLLPGDDAQARAVAAHLAGDPRRAPVVLVSATDHDARAAAAAFRGAFRSAGLSIAAAHECAADAADAAAVAGLAVAGAPRAVVILASAAASGRIAAALRAAGFEGIITGGANLGRRRFAEVAGISAEGAIVPLVHDPETPRWAAFARTYRARFGADPDFAAGAAYDAVRTAAAAAGRAGLDRERLREALRDTAAGDGVTGPIVFDRLGRNSRPVRLAIVTSGGGLSTRLTAAPTGEVSR